MNKEELLDAVKRRSDDWLQLIGHMEVSIDIINKSVELLANEVEASGVALSPELKNLIAYQQQLLQNSSIKFDQLTEGSFEEVKINNANNVKGKARKAQERYYKLVQELNG